MKYFFDIASAAGASRDDIGCECEGYAAARNAALLAIGHIAAEELPHAFTSIVLRVRDGLDVEVYRAVLTLEEVDVQANAALAGGT